VNEGNAKFQQAIADEKFTARRPVLIDLKAQFDADATHLRSKASHGKITPALATEMKKDVDKIRPFPRQVNLNAGNLPEKNLNLIQRSIRSATNLPLLRSLNFVSCSGKPKVTRKNSSGKTQRNWNGGSSC
jgi:hypothetical protein